MTEVRSRRFGQKNRIVIGNYLVEITLQESGEGTIFHWVVRALNSKCVLALGEQRTYEIARQEALHQLMSFKAQDETDASLLQHAAGA